MKSTDLFVTKEWLKIVRIRLGLTMQDIADEMRTSKQVIWNVEHGKSSSDMAFAFYERVLKDRLKETPLEPMDFSA